MLLEDLDVEVAFRLVQIDGKLRRRTLSKSDYYGYLEIDVSTLSWTYDPNSEVLVKNYTHLDFEICNEDHLSSFVGSHVNSNTVSMERAK